MFVHAKSRLMTVVTLVVICGWMPTNLFAGHRLALVIGNDAYGGTNRLASCVNDANAIAQWLQSAGYENAEIAVVTDATRNDMISALDALVQRSKQSKPQQVLIYYSGHGITLEDDNGDEGPNDPNDEAFVTVDDIESAESVEELIVRDDLFYEFTRELRKHTQRLVVLLDCCYSGGGLKAIGSDSELPAKAITEMELYASLNSNGVSTNGLRPVAPAASKDIRTGAGIPAELRQDDNTRGGELLFLSASNEFQRARAGDPTDPQALSAFTAALLDALARQASISIEQLQQQLVARLEQVPQTPVLLSQGLSTKTLFQPTLFMLPDQSLRQSAITTVIEQLLSLPRERFSQDWSIDLQPTRAGNIPLGARFAFTVTPNHAGFLILFTVEASGEVTFLYPNPYRTDNYVRAGTTRTIPYRDALLVERPVGTETYFAYLLGENPFREFPFSQHAGLAAGHLEDIIRRRPELTQQLGVSDLHQALTRGMTVEALRPTASKQNESNSLIRWSRQVVTLRTVEP